MYVNLYNQWLVYFHELMTLSNCKVEQKVRLAEVPQVEVSYVLPSATVEGYMICDTVSFGFGFYHGSTGHTPCLSLLWMLNPSGLQQNFCCLIQDHVPLKADTSQKVYCFTLTYAS